MRPRLRLLALLIVALLLAAGCTNDQERRPVEPGRDTPARFEFLSSWEPSISERGYAMLIDYSFAVRNIGGRAGAPTCQVRLDEQALPGWSRAPEVGVGDDVRVTGQALVPENVNSNKILPRLEPRCQEADGREVWTGVPKRFFAMEGDEAYSAMTRSGFNVTFGPSVSRAERLNIRGTRSHPEVVLTAVQGEPGTRNLTVLDVDCVGREQDLC